MRSLFFNLAAIIVLAASANALAAPGSIRVQSVAEQEVQVRLADGRIEVKRQVVEKALPGSEVIYTTRFTNEGKKPAGNIVINNPVPANTQYVGGSAFGENTTILYSVDGKAFNTPDRLSIRTQDGRERPALPTDYTHIRWIYKGELAPGKTGETGFRVKIQ